MTLARGAVVLTSVALSLFAVSPAAQQPPIRGLTANAEIARAYAAIFDARFSDIPPLLTRTCPPAPRDACQLLEAVSLWWQIQLDPYNRTRDAAFESRIEAAIAAIGAWTTREPNRAEAWFYLGGAYGARVQLRVLRGSRLAAARDGARIKESLERALALDPQMTDAFFGVGLYHYYAAVAPPAARMLRWLLLLPGGDRAGGLDEMHRARGRGLLVRDEADYQLHIIDVWYEKQYRRALEYLAALTARHPRNPHFRQATAEILDFYIDDTAASLRTWQSLLDAARRREVEAPEMAEVSARLGVALQLDQLSQSEAAVEQLRAVIASAPSVPFGAVARAQLQLGDALEHLGRRTESSAAYRAAIAAAGSDDPLRIASRARVALKERR
jgi:tetratricopeptide (TPR) repeat protein